MQAYEISPDLVRQEPQSLVYKGLHRPSGAFVLIKKFPYLPASPDGSPPSFIGELGLFNTLNTDYVIKRFEILEDVEDGHPIHYIVYEPLYTDLAFKIISAPLSSDEIKKLLLKLLKCVDHIHSNGIIHRNLNPSTLLFDLSGETLKIGDAIGQSFRFVAEIDYPGTVTRAYQAPEVLLGATDYSTPVDIWAVGCIFAEMVTGNVLFVRHVVVDDPEQDVRQQLYAIFRQLGGPKLDQWPGLAQLPGWQAYQNWDKGEAPLYEGNLPRHMAEAGVLLEDAGADLLMKMLTFDPKKRITAKEAANHPYFGVKNRHQGTLQIPENPQI